MSRYEISRVESTGDWDLMDERGAAVAYWSAGMKCIHSLRTEFGHLDNKPATEAHGLMILNAVKAQLEAEDKKGKHEKTDSI